MGALAQDFINQPANNSDWAGQGKLGSTVDLGNGTLVGDLKKASANKAMQNVQGYIGSSASAYRSGKLGLAIQLGEMATSLLSELIPKLTGDDRTKAEAQKKELEKQQLTMQEKDALNDKIGDISAPVSAPPASGATLPAVLRENAKALVDSLNTYTTTFGQKLDYMNESVMGIMTCMGLAVDFMDKAYKLNKDSADNAKKKEDDNTVQVGDTKMTPAEIEAKKNLAMWKAYDFKSSPISENLLEASNMSGLTPLQIEASKNSYIVEAKEFAKKPVEQTILQSDSVVGMSPREIEVSHRSNEVEAKVYARTATTVKDIDENVLFDIAPREARLVKDATVAIETTDKNNFSLDDEDVDLANPVDIKTVFGYKDDTEVIREVFARLGGVGLPSL